LNVRGACSGVVADPHAQGLPILPSLRALSFILFLRFNCQRFLPLFILLHLNFCSFQLATVLRGEYARNHLSSFIACFGGGVFLATCLLDLLPDAIESFEKTNFDTSFPVAESAVIGGLLIVLFMEQIVLTMRERGCLVSGHTHLHSERDDQEIQGSPTSMVSGEERNSAVGALLLVLVLSLHALFEGLSIAVVNDASKLVEVFVALTLHKCVIGFSLGVRLVQSGLRTSWVALSSCIFSVQILIGGFGGLELMALLSGGDRATAALVSSILQGIACGTFLYITTFEVVPHELDRMGNRIVKWLFLFLGVLVIAGFMAVFPETD
ncbi:unnamed protein product, partial [Angiostrongylus costaricensis]|uniref:Zinc transporter ZIP1 n=1 Tax=Angiostrongylus costaricensis TaxID=334426 RepID=A0A0R3P9J7_ANGCS